MKIVHLSDTHLGYRQFHKTDPEADINQREQDVYDAFEQAVDQIIETDPELVLHAGDLFHTVRPSNRAVNVATEQFARLSRAKIPTVVIAGNHDTPKIATTGTIMQSLDQLPDIHAVTSDASQAEGGYREITVGNASVHAVSDAPLEQELIERLNSVESNPDSKWNILLLHAGVRDIKDDVYSGEFNEHYVTTDYLESAGMDYVALGHYHKRMRLDCDVIARYCGAIERFSFNEANHQPGYLELEFDDEISVDEKTLKTRPFYDLPKLDGSDMKMDEIRTSIEEQLPDPKDREGGLLSVVLTNVPKSRQPLLDQEIFEDLRSQMFETNVQMVDPEGDVATEQDLQFKDLRQEFEDYLDDQSFVEDQNANEIRETGREYLARAMGEEDQV